MKPTLAALAASALSLAVALPAHATEVRTCAGPLRTAPLNDERQVNSALLQAFAVVNTGSRPVTLSGVRLQVRQGEQVTDTRLLGAEDVARAVRQGPMIKALTAALPGQFCNGTMLADASLAHSASLAPGEAVVFTYQPFVWKGARDRIDLVALTADGNAATEAVATLAIDSTPARTKALYPLAGRSNAITVASFHTTHRWASIEEFALDIVMTGAGGGTFRGTGERLQDYYAFGKPIRSVAAGRVVRVRDGAADNVAMLKRKGESAEAYFARLLKAQDSLITAGIEAVLGNHVVIDHGNGEYSVYAHLRQGSVTVRDGQAVTAGERIAALGSSGNSTEPHLHFQICDNPDMNRCRALPVAFRGINLPLDFAPRMLQSGDLVETVE